MVKLEINMRIAQAFAAILLCFSTLLADEKPPYMDARQPIDRRVADLLSRMTLKEKVGQMNMPCVYLDVLGRDIPSKRESLKRLAEGVFRSEEHTSELQSLAY